MTKFRIVANDDSIYGGPIFGDQFLFYVNAKDIKSAIKKAHTQVKHLKLGWLKRDLFAKKARKN